ASNLVSNDGNGGVTDTFVYDRVTDTTELVSRGLGGAAGNGDSDFASITPDGRYVAFSSTASNLVVDDTNGLRDVFVFDRLNPTMERVSVMTNGAQLNGESALPSISDDGRLIVFHSNASNVTGDANGTYDTFVFDRETHTLARVSNAADAT